MSTSGRGLGPFSGGQLTILVCVIVAAVAFPVGAFALTGTNVFVTDAASGKTAKVSASGALSVSGSVTADDASPKSLYQNLGDTSTSSVFNVIATPPPGKALVVTSISVDTFLDATPGDTAFASISVSATDATCTTTFSPMAFVTPSAIGMTTIPIPSGFVVPADRSLCAQAVGGVDAAVMTFGYLVPAASAPAGETPRKP